MNKWKIISCALAAIIFLGCGESEEAKAAAEQKRLAKGKILYKECMICHGEHADKSYMEQVPPIRDIGKEAVISMMKSYRDGQMGEKGMYGLAILKGEVMLHLSDENIEDIASYIESMKATNDAKTSNKPR